MPTKSYCECSDFRCTHITIDLNVLWHDSVVLSTTNHPKNESRSMHRTFYSHIHSLNVSISKWSLSLQMNPSLKCTHRNLIAGFSLYLFTYVYLKKCRKMSRAKLLSHECGYFRWRAIKLNLLVTLSTSCKMVFPMICERFQM